MRFTLAILVAGLVMPTMAAEIATPPADAVQLEVQVIEISHTRLKQLGIAVAKLADQGPDSAIGKPVEAAMQGAAINSRYAVAVIDRAENDGLRKLVDTMVENDAATIVAAPTLTCASGREAHLDLRGDETPITVEQPDQRVAIQYRKLGLRLRLVPTVLNNGNTSIQLASHLARLETKAGAKHNPRVTVSEIQTAMEMQPGESLLLVGGTGEQKFGKATGKSADKQVARSMEQVETILLVRPNTTEKSLK